MSGLRKSREGALHAPCTRGGGGGGCEQGALCTAGPCESQRARGPKGGHLRGGAIADLAPTGRRLRGAGRRPGEVRATTKLQKEGA